MGKLIVIDGLDASGKETQVKILFGRLKNMGKNVIRLDFPNYDKKYCEPVNMYLNGEFGSDPNSVNAYIASTFFAVDRISSYISQWKKYYESDYILIADRYASSNPIYHMGKVPKEKRIEYLDWEDDFEFNKLGIPRADKTIFIDMPPEFAFKLIESRGNSTSHNVDIHEKNKKYLKECYESAKFCVDYYKWNCINAVENDMILSREEMSDKIFHVIEKII